MGNIESVYFLNISFNIYGYPIALTLFSLLIASGLFNKITLCLRLKDFNFIEDNDELLEEGKIILRRHKQ